MWQMSLGENVTIKTNLRSGNIGVGGGGGHGTNGDVCEACVVR